MGLVGFEIQLNLFQNLFERSTSQKLNLETALYRAIVSVLGTNLQNLMLGPSIEGVSLQIQRNTKLEIISKYLEPLSFGCLSLTSKSNQEEQNVFRQNSDLLRQNEQAAQRIAELTERLG